MLRCRVPDRAGEPLGPGPDPAIPFPTQPSWGYRVTQGLHVAAGTAAVPLLLVKLWTVLPRLFRRLSHAGRDRLLDLAERGSIAVLVAAAVFQLATGLANSAQWYPWDFRFRATHHAVAWVAVGALVVHVAVKLPVIRAALTSDVEDGALDRAETGGACHRSRAAGSSRAPGPPPLTRCSSRRAAPFPPSDGSRCSASVRAGPGGVPINKSATAAGVTAAALSGAYTLTVAYGGREATFTRGDLSALPQHTESLPIACVEGWSAMGVWTGVQVRELLASVGAPAGSDVRVESLQPDGPYRVTLLPEGFADDERTLIALSLAGSPLSLDHGYPARLIAPNRPGVLQTKWVTRLEVLA